MLVILPDPTTRECRRHRGEYLTDSIPCLSCESERLSERILAGLRAALPGVDESEKAAELPVRYCNHPELLPTAFDQPKPAPAQIVYHCRCGENWACPVCRFGAGSWPCRCMREDAARRKSKSKPSIDWQQLQEAQAQLEELRRLGVEPKGYDIVSPYERGRYA